MSKGDLKNKTNKEMTIFKSSKHVFFILPLLNLRKHFTEETALFSLCYHKNYFSKNIIKVIHLFPFDILW